MGHSAMFNACVRALQTARRENLAAAGAPMPKPEPHPGWSRRRFLRAAAVLAGGGTGLALTPWPALARPKQGQEPRIAIVGAGLAGLNAAFHLRQRGLRAHVFEARHRLGGRVASVARRLSPGQILDMGGSFINSDHADMRALARTFGLTLFDRSADAAGQAVPDTAFFFQGRRVAEAEMANALRPLAERIAQDAARLDADFERFAPLFDRLSVAQYLDLNAGKIGEPFVRTLVEASIRSEYGVEPSDSSALQLLFNLPTVEGETVEVLGNSDERFVVDRGAGTLIAAFGRLLRDQIRLGTRLVRLEGKAGRYRLTFAGPATPLWHDPDGDDGSAHAVLDPPVVTADDSTFQVEAEYVILTLPFTLLRQVELAVPLPAGLSAFIEEGDLGRNEKVFAGFSSRAWRRNDGFFLELWGDLGFSQVWEETQRQPGRSDGALTFYTGGAEAAAIQGKAAESLGAAFVTGLETAVPGVAAAAAGTFARTGWTRDPFSKGGYSSFRPGQITRFASFFWIAGDTPADSQEVVVGNLAFAGEHLSDAFYGFMNGAAQTGRLAAGAIARCIAAADSVPPQITVRPDRSVLQRD